MDIAITDFEHWRVTCRALLAQRVAPDRVRLSEPSATGTLFAEDAFIVEGTPQMQRVPREFVELAEAVACHRSPQRWQLMYRVLYRLIGDEPQLLQITTDDDVHQLLMMEKHIRRDCHKMKAFVRFRRVVNEGGEHYVAWHRPDHVILRRVAPFFSRRFTGMHWTILTPDESVTWDGQSLEYGPGMPRSAAPEGDELEALWKTYYGSTFNPARIKLAMMRKEMPVRHWSTLPETTEIDRLLQEAPERVERMVSYTEGLSVSAADFVPNAAKADWSTLQQAAAGCRGCELCQAATQTVFGVGPTKAAIMIVGEQPGDVEDRMGQPFVGPAGQLLSEALAESGLARADVYLTNAVKHFHFQERGKQRLHKTPSSRHINACRPWLAAEVELMQPKMLVCLGATALHAVVGRHVKLTDLRGQIIESPLCPQTMATWHPAAIPRALPEQQSAKRRELVEDLRQSLLSLRERNGLSGSERRHYSAKEQPFAE